MYQSDRTQAGRLYAQVGVQSALEDATPHRLIEMLFDALVTKIRVARASIECNQITRKCDAISRAISILDGLRAALNHDVGSQISAHLDNLYDYAQRRLVEANCNSDTQLLDEVLSLIVPISEAWSSIPESFRGKLEAA
jgi:flagellar protein FliS